MSVQPGSEQEPSKSEVKLTPAQKLDAYIATLTDRHDFNVMEDQMQFLIVKRNANETHSEPWPDNGWMLTTKGVDKEGRTIGIVEKLLSPEDEEPARKAVDLANAFAYTEEVLKAKGPKVTEDLGEQALEAVGAESPNTADELARVRHLENLNATKFDVGAPKEAAEVVKHESQESQEVIPEPQSEIEQIEKALKEVEASLPEQDRAAAWQYAIALYPHEYEAAIKKMTAATRDSRAYLRYSSLFSQLQAAREKAKK